MLNYTLVKGATSQIVPLSVFDSSSVIGEKLAGLLFNTASLTAYYNRNGAAGAAVAITLATATKGTWVSGGFVAVDGTNMPGDYELHIPDAVIASGVDSVLIQLKGAADMVPVNITLELVNQIDLGTDNRPFVTADAHTSGQTVADNTAVTAALAIVDALVDKIPLSDGSVSWNPTALAAINAEADTALIDYAGPTATEMTAENDTIITQIENIGAAVGGSLPFRNEGDNVAGALKSVTFVGVETAGTNTTVDFHDGAYHIIDDTGNAFDVVYQFDVGGGRTASEVIWTGYLASGNDVADMQVYNGSTWDTVATISGKAGTTNDVISRALFGSHTGVGGDLGLVFVRIVCTGQSNPTLNTDQLIVSAVNIGQSVGYANGQVSINTVNGVAGVEPFVNGVADNATDLMASGFTIATSVNLQDFHIINGSAIVIASSAANKSFFGDHWTLDLNGQACGGIYVQGATVSGIGTSAGEEMHFEGCDFGTATVEQAHWDKCGFTGTVTLNTADSYDLHGCYSKGSAVPVFTKTAGQTIVFETHNYSGDITLNGLQVGDEIELSGTFRTITLNGTGGTAHVHGDYETLAGTLAPTLVVGVKQGYSGGAVVIDTNNGASGSVVNVNGTEENPSDNFADAVVIAAAMTPLPLSHFHQRKGSSITLVSDFTAFLFNGVGGTIALGGRTLNLCTFKGMNLTGIVNSATTGRLFVDRCLLTDVTMTDAAIESSSLSGTFTVSDTGAYSLLNCNPQDSENPPTIDMGAAVGDTSVELLEWYGPITISNLGATGTDTLYIVGGGEITLDVTCTGGTIVYVGDFTFTNNGTTSAITHIGGATEDKQDNLDTNVAAIIVDTGTSIPATLTTLSAKVGTLAIPKNAITANIPFRMLLTANNQPATGLTITAERLLDNGTFEAVTGSVVEKTKGWYLFTTTAADTNCDIGIFNFSAATANETGIPFQTVS